MGHNPAVVLRRQISVLLLVLVFGPAPELLGQGVHSLWHHDHAGDSSHHDGEWLELAKSLVHGHHHSDGEPDHEHRLLPSPTFRPDSPPELQAPVIASLEAPELGQLLLPSAYLGRDRPGLSGPSPPRLHLLCTLLI